MPRTSPGSSDTAATTTWSAWRPTTSPGRFAGPDEVLVPGLVFACDIQLFRLDEEIGIRIEDTVAVTERAAKTCRSGVPRTVAEIEALMKRTGFSRPFERSARFDGKK